MKKSILSLVCLPMLAMALTASTASAWGPAGHAHIGKELGCKLGYLNLQEMYGANAPDFPWVMLDTEYDTIRDLLGYLTHYEFENVVNKAVWPSQKAFAYGFATHNEEWGADCWAHIHPAYTTNQAVQLVSAGGGIWNQVKALGLEPLWVAELAVEYGIDILIKENEDPEIGLRVLGSAVLRSPTIPLLLAKAYAVPLASATGWAVSSFQAAKMIIASEKQFRELIMSYGMALLQQDTVDAVAEIAATQFAYLITAGPPDPQVLKVLAIGLLSAAKQLCAPTYSSVLQDTITDVAPEDHGIPYPLANQ